MRRRIRKLADYFAAATFVLVVALVAAWFGRVGEYEYAGPFRVMDGDSLEARAVRFRLEGIDAPEYRQTCTKGGVEWPCGRDAAGYLRQVMAAGDAICTGFGEDKFGRVLVRCFADGRDINEAMVENGWAVSFGDYYRAERQARNAGRGIWQGEFLRPRDWRDLHADASGDGGEHNWAGRFWAWMRSWF